MAEQIEADYGVLEQIHKKFLEQSEAIQKTVQNLHNRMQPLEDGGWVGKGSDAFFKEMNNTVFRACDSLKRALDEAAETTKKVGQTVQQAEQDAKNAFRVG